jgi:hypothetical protein
VDTIDALLHAQEQQHHPLSTTVTRLETAHRDDDDMMGGDIVPTVHKLEFSKFDGTGDPLLWLNHCKRYVHVRRTPDHQQVSFTAFYLLDDGQLWFHHMELNSGWLTWDQFVKLNNACFGPPLTDSPLGELAMLRRMGTIDEFSNQFMALSCRVPTLLESQQVQLYITGLGDPLCNDVTLQQLASLDDAVIFACAYEQRNTSREVAPPQPLRPTGRTFSRPVT